VPTQTTLGRDAPMEIVVNPSLTLLAPGAPTTPEGEQNKRLAEPTGETPPSQRPRLEVMAGLLTNEETAPKLGEEEKSWIEEELDQNEVARARQVEIERLKEFEVFVSVPRERAAEAGKKIISTRWVDKIKGEGLYRSRFVSREYANELRGDIWAATPSLTSMRVLLTKLASRASPTMTAVTVEQEI